MTYVVLVNEDEKLKSKHSFKMSILDKSGEIKTMIKSKCLSQFNCHSCQKQKNSTTIGPWREVVLISAVGGSSMIGNIDVGEMEKGWDGLTLSSFV